MKSLKRILLIVLGVLIVIQFVPVSRTNPTVSGDIQAAADFKALLHRSCYDCHSNETRWPWYSHVAPASWLVINDVHGGRKHLNFSKWQEYSAADRGHFVEAVIDHVTHGEMPLRQYLLLHRDARLSQADIAMFKQWAASQGYDAESNSGAQHDNERHDD